MAQWFPIRAVYCVQVGLLTIHPFIPITTKCSSSKTLMSRPASRSSYATLTAEEEDKEDR